MDLEGREMNYLSAAFFSVIGKAWHLIGSDALAKVILDLKASMCS